MDSQDRFSHEFNRFSELRRRLIEADPDIDDRTLADTLEGATNLKEAIGCVARSALDDEALAEGLKLRLETMRERLERIEATAANKRQVALAAMEEADIEKILEPDFTVSIRAAPPSVVRFQAPYSQAGQGYACKSKAWLSAVAAASWPASSCRAENFSSCFLAISRPSCKAFLSSASRHGAMVLSSPNS